MRTFRVLAIVVAVSLLVVPATVFASVTAPDGLSAAPSKVCHPKKPVTCRASELSTVVVSTEAAATVTDSRFESNQAMVCYGSRFNCRTITLSAPVSSEKPAPKVETDSRLESNQAMVCYGSRFNCRAITLS